MALAQPTTDTHLLASARESYERGHYAQAFAAYARLADAGNCDAARVSLLMARFGPSLYGQTFGVDAARVRRWRDRIGCDATLLVQR